jgi:ParB family transcriptional regulator, chromosome partitioning protein
MEEREGIEQVVELLLVEIRPDPNQPRTIFRDESLEELAASIEQGGLYQPITVRPAEEGYVIVAGHRRFKAHELLRMERIRALIRHVDERDAFIIALNENLQREDLTPFEEAQGYRRLIGEFGLSQRQVAEQVGKKESVISETLKFLELPEEIRNEYLEHPVSKSLLIQLVRLKSKKRRLDLWKRIKEGEIATVQDAREAIAAGEGRGGGAEPGPRKDFAQRISLLVSSAGKLKEFPLEHYEENPHEYRRLVDLSAALAAFVEGLKERFGEPPSLEELPPRRRGRKLAVVDVQEAVLEGEEVLESAEPEEPA